MERNNGVSAGLAAAAEARLKLAERISTPWWYHPALGLLMGLLVLAVGGSIGKGLVVLPLVLVGTLGLGLLYRNLSGVDLRGPHAPDGGKRGRALLAIVLATLIASCVLSYLFGHEFGIGQAPWILAAVALVVTVVAGRAYDNSLRAQLRDPNS
ncbi:MULTISPECIES: hypothetical protein [unclassified Cryobacterium]|uniref:hypothetical protein n=1 Tax=unclassified Cryobacterium TaxID=2649013 RepID=UPI00141ACC4C|nr:MULTISPECIES: hypothetical protein [unclassified Cryobacterium]